MYYWFTYDGHLLPSDVPVCDIDLVKGIGYASFMRTCVICNGTGCIGNTSCSFCNGTGKYLVTREPVHEHYHYLNTVDAEYPFLKSPELTQWKLENAELIDVLKTTVSPFAESLYKVLTEGRFLTVRQEISANEILASHKDRDTPQHTIKIGDKITVNVRVKESSIKTSPITNLAYYSFVCIDEIGKHFIVYQNKSDAMFINQKYMLTGIVKKRFLMKYIDYAVIGVFNLKIT
ncbi:hypothetical protein [Yersinia intermedia]|uniref:hypothetical protein n=1 Tax=Yersinia intermedia TaxID=631 RepID=UPI00065CFA20|nr:hypothetical protein [Yersinia intermedia]CRY83962.1 Uncharacterised protein [Yersinia intermedia]